jgi:16S rRNA (cytidine1402-2'-O)-methyltransferase
MVIHPLSADRATKFRSIALPLPAFSHPRAPIHATRTRLSTEIVAFSPALGYAERCAGLTQASAGDRPAENEMKEAISEGAGAARPQRSFLVHGAVVPASPLPSGLYVVATPIGNLADVTLRALAILAGADAILAEDTRVSRTLLSRYGIATPLTPYHEHNAAEARPRALRRISEGAALALISDAGTPLISDPGYKLVAEAIGSGFAVSAAPGASAALAALCIAGLPTDRFFFEGFLPPRSAARRQRINALAAVPGTIVFYESPSRLAGTLTDLALELGPRPAAVARELTKLHEEVRRGALDDLAAEYATQDPPKGEIVIVVGAAAARETVSEDALDREIVAALATLSIKDAAAAVAARHGLPRREIYARALALSGAAR